MVNHTFTYTEIFYAQYYRYRFIMSVLIIGFGLFSIGVMVVSGAFLSIGIALFIAYAIMAYAVMFGLLSILALIYYRSYKNVLYTYEIKAEMFIVSCNHKEIARLDYTLLETKVYRKLTYVYDRGNIVAFFPEKVRLALLK